MAFCFLLLAYLLVTKFGDCRWRRSFYVLFLISFSFPLECLLIYIYIFLIHRLLVSLSDIIIFSFSMYQFVLLLVKSVLVHNCVTKHTRIMSSKRQLLKIIIVGDSGVGKSSLMHQYVNKKFDGRYKATIGADFLTKDIEINGQPVALQIWDTAGQERFQSLGSAFYRGADACILVFDVTQQDSFSHINSWLEEFSIQAGKQDCILIGNKADLADRRQVPAKTAQTWCTKRGGGEAGGAAAGRGDGVMRYFETSAKENTGVEEAFLAVATSALAKKATAEGEIVMPQSVNLNQPKPQEKKSSCAC